MTGMLSLFSSPSKKKSLTVSGTQNFFFLLLVWPQIFGHFLGKERESVPGQHTAHRNLDPERGPNIIGHITYILWDVTCSLCASQQASTWPAWWPARIVSPDVREVFWHRAECVLWNVTIYSVLWAVCWSGRERERDSVPLCCPRPPPLLCSQRRFPKHEWLMPWPRWKQRSQDGSFPINTNLRKKGKKIKKRRQQQFEMETKRERERENKQRHFKVEMPTTKNARCSLKCQFLSHIWYLHIGDRGRWSHLKIFCLLSNNDADRMRELKRLILTENSWRLTEQQKSAWKFFIFTCSEIVVLSSFVIFLSKWDSYILSPCEHHY